MALSQYKAIGDAIGAAAFSDFDTVQRFPLGYEVQGQRVKSGSADSVFGAEAAVFKYAQGSDVASAGQFVHLSLGSAVLLASANSASKWPVGVACAALSATSRFGWVQVEGPVDYARGTNSSIAAGVPLYIAQGTAGYLVTNVTSGQQVFGVVAPASYTSSQSQSLSVMLNRPLLIGVLVGSTNASVSGV